MALALRPTRIYVGRKRGDPRLRSKDRPQGARPHVRCLWLFIANRLMRIVDGRRTGRPDGVVYRVNALDADAIGFNMVIARYWERVRALVVGGISEHVASVRSWHRLRIVGLIRSVAGVVEEAEIPAMGRAIGVSDRIRVWPRSPHPFPYVAAADVLVAPSREDSFNLPAMEALAFGLLLAVSRRAGLSELVGDAKHALVVDDPEHAGELAAAIGRGPDAGLASRLTQSERELAER